LRILIHAWRGATVGDTVLTEATGAWLRKNYAAQVVFNRPENGLKDLPRFDGVILGPCGVVYDPGPPRPNDLYSDYTDFMTSYIFRAHKLGIPVMAFNVGVQQLLRAEKVQKWARALSLCDPITTREEHTAAIFRMIGVKSRVVECRDIGYSLEIFNVKKARGPARHVLGVNLRGPGKAGLPWKVPEMRKAMGYLRRAFNLKFLVFSPTEQRMAKVLKLPYDQWPSYSLKNVAQLYERLDYLISSHFHCHVFATMAGIPFLQYYGGHRDYGPGNLPRGGFKNIWDLEETKYKHVWTKHCSALCMLERVKALYENDHAVRLHLARIRRQMEAPAKKNWEILRLWLEEKILRS
jgi:hypothetical protein